ncbi:CDP-diacylglycerol--serine O-phosphatidyltransferase [Candidatus Latescibacterota bacterium]
MVYRALIPNVFTVGNLFCGFAALSYIIGGKYVPAAWLIVLGAALDNMDGRIARFMGQDSRFGIEFDSLADVCTFGVVPAVMIYHALLQSGWGLLVGTIFLLCGALRLARYNVLSHENAKSNLFLGLPIPAAAIALSQYIVYTERAWETEHAASLGTLFALLLAFLMVSRIEYDPVPNFRSAALRDRLKVLYFLGSVGLVIYPGTSKELFFPIIAVYLFSGIYRWVNGMFSGEVTQHA